MRIPNEKIMMSVLLALTLLLAACGSNDAEDTTDTTDTTDAGAAESGDEATASSTTVVEVVTSEDVTTSETTAPGASGFSLMDFRYCEILLTFTGDDGNEVTEVWGTPGVDPCTDEAWYAIDPEAIQAESGASFVRMNGPRYFIVDGTADTGDGTEGTGTAAGGRAITRQFGDITMTLLATTEAGEEGQPYTPDLVVRTTTWTYEAGTQVFELTDPEGEVYTMQSYSLIEDRSLTLADLPTLGERLDLPEGWSYSSRVLDEPLQVELSPEGALVMQDEFSNSYQRNG